MDTDSAQHIYAQICLVHYFLCFKPFKVWKGKVEWKIRRHVDSQTSNVVYMIECQKQTCQLRYIGETNRTVKEKFPEQKGYIINKKLNQATGNPSNQLGQSLHDLKIGIVEKVKNQDELKRKVREQFHINKFNTYYEGVKKQH